MGAGGNGTDTMYQNPANNLQMAGKKASQKPVLEKQSSVVKGTSNRIFAISSTSADDATNEAIPNSIEVKNDGRCPINILTGYETYSNETTGAGATRYLHTMLMPGESFNPPVRSVISTENASTQFDGTISNSGNYAVPASSGESNLKADSTANVASEELNDTADPIVIETSIGHEAFRVGDLLRVNNEILRVEGTYDDNPTSSTVADNHIVVSRGKHGSTIASHSGTPDIYYAFFNAYHDYNSFSYAQTDGQGKFMSTNFFGLGRGVTASASSGLVPGSVALRFYNPGYQDLGLNGVTAASESGLTAGATYYGSISIDGATADKFTFTVDSTNTNFGGKNGVIAKMQSAIDALFYNPAKNNFEKGARISIVNGDIRVASSQRTANSAIALTTNTDGSSGTDELWDGTNTIGRIPSSPKGAVSAKLPDLNTYDRVTYKSSVSPANLAYDDGMGNILGAAEGWVNYETGAINISAAPPNASFEYLVNHSSAFSGKATEGVAGRINTLKEILANTPSQKGGVVTVKSF